MQHKEQRDGHQGGRQHEMQQEGQRNGHQGGRQAKRHAGRRALRWAGQWVWRRIKTADGTVLIQNLTIADGFWSKLIGLMFRRSLAKGSGLLIPKCKAVHCCFMFMIIDVLFLSPDGQIVYIIEKMRPWTFSPYIRIANAVLECESGTVERFGIKVGDFLIGE